MRRDMFAWLTGGRIPAEHFRVGIAAAENGLSVRREGQERDPAAVAFLPRQFLSTRQVPNADRMIVASGRHRLAVRGERDGLDSGAVRREGPQPLARLDVPDGDRGVEAAGNESL